MDNETTPMVCTLSAGDYQKRLASIAALNRDALRSHTRDDLELMLIYAASAADRVHRMVHEEQACCAFLTFRLEGFEDELRLVIGAPERARDAADMLFAQFLPSAEVRAECGCC